MKSVSEVSFCVIDKGLFLPMAFRLAEEAKRVIFHNPDIRAYPSLKQGSIGSGFERIEHVLDFWEHLDEIDCFVFPDSQNAGLQQHLESLGKPVWGCRGANRLELNREYFLRMIRALGLDVPPHEVIIGLDNLAAYLKDKKDHWIKVSGWRGDLETTHWRDWTHDSGWLDWQRVNLGPYSRHMKFLVFPAIDTPLEIGGDTYCVNGQWPDLMLNGYEHKDTTYFSAVTKRSEMPEQIQAVLEAFGPILGKYGAKTQWSMEVRIKDEKAYFIDPTPRGGMPSSGSQQLNWKNFPTIIWAGANGELVEPEPEAAFTIECMVKSKSYHKDSYDVVELPKELERFVRFSGCAFVDSCYVFPPDEFKDGELGWLVAMGESPRETLDHAKELADQLPDGLNADLEQMVGLIQEIETAEKKGIPFSQKPLPEPAEVVKD